LTVSLAGWPKGDKVPDTNSPEVKEWLKELEGWTIPNIPQTKDSTCLGDPAAAANAKQNGWWTCGGYTRSTDIVACPTKLDWGLSFDDGPAPHSTSNAAHLCIMSSANLIFSTVSFFL